MRIGYALLLAVSVAFAGPARADGTVHKANGCGEYVFVNTTSGYSVLVTSGGVGVKDGDNLQGDVERIGTASLYDTTSAHSVFALVTEHGLTLPEVTQRTNARCRSALAATLITGYVSRAAGCGSKIFVNTAQGYAVLDRIAGGVVADGDSLTGNFNRPGRATVEDKQSASTLTVFVEDLWLSKSAAERKMNQMCRR